MPAAENGGAEAGPVGRAHLVTDLVAAWPDGRPDDRRGSASERCDRGLEHAVQQAAPAGVDDRHGRVGAVRARQDNRHAVRA